MTEKVPQKKNRWSWRSQAFRGVLYQILAIGIVALGIWFLSRNTMINMQARGIQSGFDFLGDPAGFDIGESLFVFDSASPYWKAYLVGIVNTLRVSILGIFLTIILGTLIGIGRFSRNALVRGLCYGYVEMFRNVPILLQLLMWYLFLTEALPYAQDALTLGPLFLSKGGLIFPKPIWEIGHLWGAIGLVAGAVLGYAYRNWALRRFEATGQPRSMFWVPLAICIVSGVLAWWAGGAPLHFDFPIKGDFSIERGGALTPEFLAVLLGLTMYTSAFVAEVVRSGIQSVAAGQIEAAAALGLQPRQVMRLITLPQALRVIIPPVTNQFLNLTKNSSLAVAIGYPDVVSIANTSLNQTGRAVEAIAIVMLVYLTTSLTTSMVMGWYNARAAIQER